MEQLIISIGRECGSGGHEIAEKLAVALADDAVHPRNMQVMDHMIHIGCQMGKFHKNILPCEANDGSRIAFSAHKVKMEVAFFVEIRSRQNSDSIVENDKYGIYICVALWYYDRKLK